MTESGLQAGDVVTGEWDHDPVLLVRFMGTRLNPFSFDGGDVVTEYERDEEWDAISTDGSPIRYFIKENSFGKIVPLNRSLDTVLSDM